MRAKTGLRLRTTSTRPTGSTNGGTFTAARSTQTSVSEIGHSCLFLAFIYAQLGNKTKANHYIQQYEDSFGEYGVTEDQEKKLIATASQLSSKEFDAPANQKEYSTLKDNHGGHTYFIESDDESEMVSEAEEESIQ